MRSKMFSHTFVFAAAIVCVVGIIAANSDAQANSGLSEDDPSILAQLAGQFSQSIKDAGNAR